MSNQPQRGFEGCRFTWIEGVLLCCIVALIALMTFGGHGQCSIRVTNEPASK